MKQTTGQIPEPPAPATWAQERTSKQQGVLSQQTLAGQNRDYAGSPGVSRHNRGKGFVPAFLDTRTGRSVISRYADGSPAPIHMLDSLPDEWVSRYDATGHVASARPGVVAGFLRSGRFYTREQATKAI